MKSIKPGCIAICIHPSAMNEECEIIRIVKRKAFLGGLMEKSHFTLEMLIVGFVTLWMEVKGFMNPLI